MADCLYIAPDLGAIGSFTDERRDDATERHKMALQPPPLQRVGDVAAEIDRLGADAGVVLALKTGFLTRAQMRIAARTLNRGRRVWLFWPAEDVVECVDRERLKSFHRLWMAVIAFERLVGPVARTKQRLKRV